MAMAMAMASDCHECTVPPPHTHTPTPCTLTSDPLLPPRFQPARPDDVVFTSLSLDVEVGKTLALVGPSGGGKSTITKLLLRFYDPTHGSVVLDGLDIKTLNVAWYRNQVQARRDRRQNIFPTPRGSRSV